jgi:hypothetical protein
MLDKQDLERNLDRIHGWTKACDQKICIFFALQAILISILIPIFIECITKNAKTLCWWDINLLIIVVVLMLLSFAKSISALIPRLKKSRNDESIIYFGDIAKMELSIFAKNIKETTEDEYMEALIKQIHILSQITHAKHLQLQKAIIYFISGTLMGMVEYAILAFRG